MARSRRRGEVSRSEASSFVSGRLTEDQAVAYTQAVRCGRPALAACRAARRRDLRDAPRKAHMRHVTATFSIERESMTRGSRMRIGFPSLRGPTRRLRVRRSQSPRTAENASKLTLHLCRRCPTCASRDRRSPAGRGPGPPPPHVDRAHVRRGHASTPRSRNAHTLKVLNANADAGATTDERRATTGCVGQHDF